MSEYDENEELARLNLLAAKNDTSTNYNATLSQSLETGLTFDTVKSMDNADIRKQDDVLPKLNGDAKLVLGKSPVIANGVWDRDPDAVNALCKGIVKNYKARTEGKVLKDNGQPEQERKLRKELATGGWEGQREAIIRNSYDFARNNHTAEEKDALSWGKGRLREPFGFSMGFGGRSVVEEVLNDKRIKGNPFLEQEILEDAIDLNARRASVMSYLESITEDWRDLGADPLAKMIREAGAAFNIPVDDITPESIKKQSRVDLKNLTDLFGLGSLANRGRTMALEAGEENRRNYGDVLETQSPYFVERFNEKDAKAVEQQAQAHVGETRGANIANAWLRSIRWMGELATLGVFTDPSMILTAAGIKGAGLAGLKKLATLGGAQAVAKAATNLAVNSLIVQTHPLFVAKHTNEMFEDIDQQRSHFYYKKGDEVVDIPPETVGSYADAFARGVMRNFIETFTEGLGEFVAFGFMDSLISKIPMPQKVAFLKSALNGTKNGWNIFDNLLNRTGINSFPAEMFEEVMGNVISYGVTKLGKGIGADALNLGQDSPWMGGGSFMDMFTSEEFWDTAAVIAGQQAVAAGVRAGGNVIGRKIDSWLGHKRYYSVMSVDAEIVENMHRLHFGDGNQKVIREGLRDADIGGENYRLPADKARKILDTAPEVAKALGITEEKVAKAEGEHGQVGYNHGDLLAYMGVSESNAKAGMDVLKNTTGVGDAKVSETDAKTEGEAMERINAQMASYEARMQLRDKCGKFVEDFVKGHPGMKVDASATGAFLGSLLDYFARNGSVADAEKALDNIILAAQSNPESLTEDGIVAAFEANNLIMDTDSEAGKALLDAYSTITGQKVRIASDEEMMQESLRRMDQADKEGKSLSSAKVRAWFDEKTGEIVVSRKNAVWLFGHEMTHSIRAFDKAAGTSFYDSIRDILTDKGQLNTPGLEAMRKSLLDRYAVKDADGNVVSFSEKSDELEEELCSDLMGYVLQDVNFAKDLAEEMERRQRGAGMRFLQSVVDAIKSACEAIRQAVARIGTDSLYGKYMDGLLTDYENKRSQLVSTIADFSERYRGEGGTGTEAETEEGEGRKYAKANMRDVQRLQSICDSLGIPENAPIRNLLNLSGTYSANGMTIHLNQKDLHGLVHFVETGKAETGGLTVQEGNRMLPKLLDRNNRHFDKKDGHAIYKLEDGGVRYTLVTYVKDGKEFFATLYTNRKQKETKRLQSAVHIRARSTTQLTGLQPQNNNTVVQDSNITSEKTADSDKNIQRKNALLGQRGAFSMDPVKMLASLQEAKSIEKRMVDDGAKKGSREVNAETKKATGWQRGADGNWRYEIPDDWTVDEKAFSAMQDGRKGSRGVSLGNVMKGASKLFSAYPAFRDIKLKVYNAEDGTEGSYDSDANAFNVNTHYITSAEKMKDLILHEMQHAIQSIERFSLGTSPDFEEEMKGEYSSTSRFNPFRRYWRAAGEAEARNVEARQGMTEEERRETPIEDTSDVAPEQQYIFFDYDAKRVLASKMRYSLMPRSQLSLPADNSLAKGAQAIISLMSDANTGDVMQGIARWAYAMMHAAAREGMDPTGAITDDLETMEAWIAKRPNPHKEGTPEHEDYKGRLFADAFLSYIKDGISPSEEMRNPFMQMKRILKSLYRTAAGMAPRIPSEIRSVFDRMLVAEDTVESEVPEYREAIAYLREQAGLGLLGAGGDAALLKLLLRAEDQTETEQAKEIARLLKEQMPMWKRLAKEQVEGMRVYKALKMLKDAGGISPSDAERFLNGNTEEASEVLKSLLHKTDKAKHADVLQVAVDCGYSEIEEMFDELANALPQSQMEEDIVDDYTQDFLAQGQWQISDDALANESAVKVLDRLESVIEERTKDSVKVHKMFFRSEAARRISEMTVKDVLTDKGTLEDAKQNIRDLVRNLAKKTPDWRNAVELIGSLKMRMEILKQTGAARRSIESSVRAMKSDARAPKGTIEQDYHLAIKELAYYFGLSSSDPMTGNDMRNAIRRLCEVEEVAGVSSPLHFADFLFETTRKPFTQLTTDEFEELGRFFAYVSGMGKSLVAEGKENRRRAIQDNVRNFVADNADKPHKHNDYKDKGGLSWLGSKLMTAWNWGTKLWRDLGESGATGKRLYDRMAFAENDYMQLMESANGPLVKSLNRLYELTKGIDVAQLEREGRLPKFYLKDTEGYSKWQNPMQLVMAVLYMGSRSGRQRLMDGYRWRSEEEARVADDAASLAPVLAQIASCLPAEALKEINSIWQIIGEGELTRRVRETYRAENFFDLPKVNPTPFTAMSSDGQMVDMTGGYIPIRYLYAKGEKALPEYQIDPIHNDPSSLKNRAEVWRDSAPLSLSANTLTDHVEKNARYATFRLLMKEVWGTMTSEEFRKTYGEVYGFEKYKNMMAVVKHVANPFEDLKGGALETIAKTIQVSSALMLNLSSVLMQLTSTTVGAEEIGGNFISAFMHVTAHPWDSVKAVREMSPLMRHRSQLQDFDLRGATAKFERSGFSKVKQKFAAVGYFMMQSMDMYVATIDFTAAYNKEIEDGKSETEAVAYAEEFVAKTQGAARPIDILPAQLSVVGRMMTPFITAVAAQQNVIAHDMLDPSKPGGRKVIAFVCNALAPWMLAALVRYSLKGGWGDDEKQKNKALRAAIREFLSQPLSGMPFFRDLNDWLAAWAAGSGYNDSLLEVGAFRSVSDVANTLKQFGTAISKRDWDYACYKFADAVGAGLGMPAVKMYERMQKIQRAYGIEWTPDFEKMFKDENSRKEKRVPFRNW